MIRKTVWVGLAVSALGLALVSGARADELPTTASSSPLIVQLGCAFVCVAIGLAAISKYGTSRPV